MSYYKTIDGKQMDSRLLDIALQAVEGTGDGRISQHDAEKLFEAVKDGNVYTRTKKTPSPTYANILNGPKAQTIGFVVRFHIGVRLLAR